MPQLFLLSNLALDKKLFCSSIFFLYYAACLPSHVINIESRPRTKLPDPVPGPLFTGVCLRKRLKLICALVFLMQNRDDAIQYRLMDCCEE